MAKGWKSYIAYGRNDHPSQSELIKIGNDLDVKFHVLQTRLFDRQGLGSKHSTLELVKLIIEIKPDVIHLHNLHGYYTNIEILFKYLAIANIPVVLTLHDCWAFTGHCCHFSYIGCDKWKTQCRDCPQKKEYPASYGLDRSKKNYLLKKELFTAIKRMTIVPVSQWISDIVSQSFLNRYPVHIIKNGIDTNVFKPGGNIKIKERYKVKGRFIILGVANAWSPRKGLPDFIELSRIIDKNSVIILIGLSLKQTKDVPQNIIGICHTDSKEELAKLYSIADVYINTSGEETFGLTTVEALSCGTPAVVYNATACPEVITSETGFIVEKGDFEGLLNAIKTVREKGKEQYSNACRERATKLYDSNDRYLDYLNLYESMLAL